MVILRSTWYSGVRQDLAVEVRMMESFFAADMKGAMDGFLDSVDMLEDVDISDFDLPMGVIDAPLDSGLEGSLSSSDSDSGISVSGDRNGLKRLKVKQGTPADSVLDSGSQQRFETQTKVLAPTIDCVLTDAVCSSSSQSFVSGASEDACDSSAGAWSEPFQKPIRIIKIESDKIRRSSPPENLAVASDNLQRRKTHYRILGSNSSVKVISQTVAPVRYVTTRPFADGQKPCVSILKKECDSFSLDNLCQVSETFRLNQSGEIGSFLDEYDPTAHSDPSLEKHLYGACEDLRSPFRTTQQAIDSSSVVDCPDILSPSDCIFTRAHLERIRKKQERMIKNRQAASMSRLRKKEYLERLEMRYEQLKRENMHLWRQNEEWKQRCDHLERCLDNLQSQISDVPDKQRAEVGSKLANTSGSQISPVSSGGLTINCDDQTSNTNPLRCPVSPIVRTNRPSFPSNPTTSDIMQSRTHVSLSNFGLKRSRILEEPPKRWTSCSSKDTAFQIQKAPEYSTSSSPSSSSFGRKTVINSIFYSGKTSSTLTAGSSSDLQPKQSKLVSLTGIINRHRPGGFNSTRPKLIATTSLLAIFCLFSLNVFLSPNIFRATDSGGFLSSLHLNAAKSWESAPAYSAGGRVLLSAKLNEQADEHSSSPSDVPPSMDSSTVSNLSSADVAAHHHRHSPPANFKENHPNAPENVSQNDFRRLSSEWTRLLKSSKSRRLWNDLLTLSPNEKPYASIPDGKIFHPHLTRPALSSSHPRPPVSSTGGSSSDESSTRNNSRDNLSDESNSLTLPHSASWTGAHVSGSWSHRHARFVRKNVPELQISSKQPHLNQSDSARSSVFKSSCELSSGGTNNSLPIRHPYPADQ
ncbi:unnamed protein product [Calicophoron daubneyi]|uniref:BZIP domain-containing protein n=1 Tax=Calicophoron daubneyi TaxID=300641 RepID=A0AAV2T902_CALDB